MAVSKPRSRQRNTKVEIDGHTFDSKAEGRRYLDLKMMEEGGIIRDLKPHPKYPMTCGGRPVLIKSPGYPNGRRASYTADFSYVDVATGKEVIEDVKGQDRYGARLKRAVFEAETGKKIVIVKVERRNGRRRRWLVGD